MTANRVRCNVKVLLVVAWMTAGMPGLVLAQAPAAVPPAAAGDVHARGDIGGDWQGTLETSKSPRIVVKIARADKGWSVKFYSIDQGAQLFNASGVAFDGSRLKFSINPIGGNYEGALRTDGSSIAGNWTQGPSPLVLTLVRATKETAWRFLRLHRRQR